MKRHFQASLLAFLLSAGPALSASDLTELTASEAAKAIADGNMTSLELVEALIDRTGNDAGKAYITFDPDGARAAAKAADSLQKDGAELGPLHGVPIVVKDNIIAEGLPATGGTPALKDWVPSSDAQVLAKLKEAGAILLGKTNLHELAFGITSNNAAFGAVANAYDSSRFAGGSSGGTGAAVGGHLAPAGLGTDTGGSVRIPAALNGVAGLRPSSGRYPQGGIIPISKTRDTAGPLARSVEDLVLIDGIITGTGAALTAADLKTIRIGVPATFNENIDPETDRLMKAAFAAMEAEGVALVPVDTTTIADLAGKIGFPIALWEVKRDLAQFLKDNNTGKSLEDVATQVASPDVKFVFDNLILGDQAIPDEIYETSINDLRPQLQAAYADLFAANKLDAIAFPTTPLPAQPIQGSDMTVTLNGKEVPTFQTFIRNTDPGSNAGIPGLSVPIGLTKDGLPVGLELDGPAYTDRHLLAIGLALESVLPETPRPQRQ